MSQTLSSKGILQALSDEVAGLAEKVSPSVIRVGSGYRTGSGIIWSSDGHIVTASHVIGRRNVVDVDFGADKTFEAKVIGQDPYSDIAVLKVEADGLKPIEKGNSESLKVGQFVLALANPFGGQPSMTSGIITSSKRTLRGWGGMVMEDVVITDAKLNPGYSGGPLVDASGKMIGLNTAYMSSRGIAVPIAAVSRIVDTVSTKGRITRAYLGILSDSISLPKEVTTQAKLDQDEGLIVLGVEKDTPAKKAGLAIGDVIVKFGNEVVQNLYDLHKVLMSDIVGKPVNLSVLRGEKLTDLSITPSEAEE
jgi:S1-C subfamily serine protease